MPTTLKTYGGAVKKKKRKLLPRAIRLHVGQQPSPYTVFEALKADNIKKCKNEYKNSKKENHNHCGMAHTKRKMSPAKFFPVGDSTVLVKSPELNSTFDRLFKGPVLGGVSRQLEVRVVMGKVSWQWLRVQHGPIRALQAHSVATSGYQSCTICSIFGFLSILAFMVNRLDLQAALLWQTYVLQPFKPNRLANTHGSLSSGNSSENHNFSSSYSMPSSDSPSFLGFPDKISTARPPQPFTRHRARQLKLHYTSPETVEKITLPVAALESMVTPSVILHRIEKKGTSYNEVSMGYIQSKHSPLNSLNYNVPTPVSSKMGLRREALKQNADNYLDLKYISSGISEKTSKAILEGKNDNFIADISPFLLQPNKNVTSTPKNFLAPTQMSSAMPISAGSSSIKLVKCSSDPEATSKTYLQTGNHDEPVDMLMCDRSMEVSTSRQNCDTLAKLQSTHSIARVSSVCGQIDSNRCINTYSSNDNNDPDNLCLEESSSKKVSLINCSDDMFGSYEAEQFQLPEETHKENLPSEDLPIYVTRREATSCIMGLDDSNVVCLDVQDVLEESVARSSVHITDVQDVLEESVARSSIHGADNCHIHTKKLQSTERKISLEHTPKKTYQPQSPKSMKRKRCTRFVIAGRDSSQKVSRQSIFKDVCCSFNGTFTRSGIDEEGTILKLEPTLSNASVNLPDSPIQSEEVLPSACDVVLSKCHLKRILLFSDAFSFSFLDKCSKIGEGVYGEVFSCEESCSVIKIIPIEGNQLVNGEPQKTFKEILSEIVIAM
uniref:Protein kinase domain-containing protein n=1 Tax=Timema genevievae TaxID=629358 RepID=A0A7R9K6T2_TIMGE|nr:unnamed protein product [Timema genevievae]